ncbi:hypothetical protein DUI87_26449 [Hirundo rustica rustica]|uniref:Uncharacterized protein n=1 Tax=Hirundo rustica rustica TaxID=333673 RepID=A0A3M0J8F5_HIRRU|nr:hypothetical protein DUI87_26449 [Hirundo rustica rustica]
MSVASAGKAASTYGSGGLLLLSAALQAHSKGRLTPWPLEGKAILRRQHKDEDYNFRHLNSYFTSIHFLIKNHVNPSHKYTETGEEFPYHEVLYYPSTDFQIILTLKMAYSVVAYPHDSVSAEGCENASD